MGHLVYEFEYLSDPDDLTGLNDLISHHNFSDFNDLDCLFDLKKIQNVQEVSDYIKKINFCNLSDLNDLGGLSDLNDLSGLKLIISSKNIKDWIYKLTMIWLGYKIHYQKLNFLVNLYPSYIGGCGGHPLVSKIFLLVIS